MEMGENLYFSFFKIIICEIMFSLWECCGLKFFNTFCNTQKGKGEEWG